MVVASAFQADDVGSIPTTRSEQRALSDTTNQLPWYSNIEATRVAPLEAKS